MNRAEYLAAYRATRKSAPHLTKQAMTEVGNAFKQAGELVAEQVRKAELTDASEFTIKSLQNINLQLDEGSRIIRESLESEIPLSVDKLSSRITAIDEQYMDDAIARSGSTLSRVKVKNLFVSLNVQMVVNTTTRIWSDGYTFSDRIWKVGQSYAEDMRRVLSAGLAQGRDPVKIAADLEKYIADGKQILAKRYGKLEAGTRQFVQRIPRNVDYRALRLVRSEIYTTLKEIGVSSGLANPAALDLYDWVMQAGRADWSCSCPEYAHEGPYRHDEVPSPPHPNCSCYVVARLMDTDQFIEDLKRWEAGERVDYLDEWKSAYYDAS